MIRNDESVGEAHIVGKTVEITLMLFRPDSVIRIVDETGIVK
jgi:hypothetical protein